MQIISKSGEHTKKIAKQFLKKILNKKHKVACVVGLYGDLGAGKTTFTQYVAKELGVKRKVASPTFVISKRYPLKNKMFKNFYHLDAYRLKDEKELHSLGWKETVKDPENIIFIEWPEKVAKAMPKKHYKIKIKHQGERSRKFQI
jgi:tRNA threonylcarbamoyladenosine biosynthesis protein TsaE